jgi:hypothetical protein
VLRVVLREALFLARDARLAAKEADRGRSFADAAVAAGWISARVDPAGRSSFWPVDASGMRLCDRIHALAACEILDAFEADRGGPPSSDPARREARLRDCPTVPVPRARGARAA